MNQNKLKTVIREFLSSDKGSPVIENKYTEMFLEKRQEYINNLLKNKQQLVKRYGKDAEKVLTGRAVKSAKKHIENMKQQDIKELVRKSLMKEESNDLLSQLESALKSHDWYYMMSDDNRVYKEGSQEAKNIKDLISKTGEEGMALYKRYKEENFKLEEETIDSKKYISERDINEDDWKQSDDESDMAHSQLKSIQSNASKLMNMIDNNEQLDAWVQSKLTKAQDYLQSVSDYLTGEEGEIEELYEKKAKKDYDGDGKIESSEEEYKGVKDKAIKNAKGLAEIIAKKLKESSYKAPSNSVEAGSLKKGDVLGSGETVVSVSSGAKTPSGKVDVTLEKNGKTRTAVWGKYTKVGIKKS